MVVSRAAGRWALALTSAALLMSALDILVVTTALDHIRRDLGVGMGGLEWTLSAYNIVYAALMLAAAAFGERFGRRRMLTIGVFVFSAGSAICAAAPGIAVLVGGRILQGVGAAVIAPLALPLISAATPPGHRARAFGIQAGVTGLATLLGPVVGGTISDTLGWQWIFWINVPLGLALMPLVHFRITEQQQVSRRLDLPGVLLASLALLASSSGLTNAADHGWTHPLTLPPLAVGAAAAAGFVAWELRAAAPMLPIRLLRRTNVGTISVITLLHSVVVVGSVFIMAQFLQSGLQLTATQAGLGLLPWTGTMIFIAPLAGRYADRYGPRAILMSGLAAATAGYAALAGLAAAGESSYLAYMVPLVIVGIGNSAAFPAITALVDLTAPPGHLGASAGTNSATRELGAVLGVALITLAFTTAGGIHSTAIVLQGFSASMAVCAAASLLAIIAAATLTPRTQHLPRLTPSGDAAQPAARAGHTKPRSQTPPAQRKA